MAAVQVLNMLCCWVEDRNSEAFKLHLPRIYDYLWIAEDGMKMQVSLEVNEVALLLDMLVYIRVQLFDGLLIQILHVFVKGL